MKLPREAPQFEDLISSLQPQDLKAVMERTPEVTADDSYLHWDEIRYRSSPDGLSHEQWWMCLKFSRMAHLSGVPLTTAAGAPFVYGLPPKAQELLECITRQASGTVRDNDLIINPDTQNEYLVRNLMEEGIQSSLMEGAATTRARAKEAILSQRKKLTEGERMAVNNYRAMQYIQELGKVDLTPSIIYDLHRVLAQGTMNDDKIGRPRRPDELVDVVDVTDGAVMHVPPPAKQLPERMQAMCDFANATKPYMHPVVRSIILHFWLAYDHPFTDGNGRCARGLFYWSMLRHDYWMCQYFSISEIMRKAPKKYGLAFLHTETDGNDLTYFILHQLRVIDQAITQLYKYLERKTNERRRIEQQPELLTHFNRRQRQVIMQAMRRPHSSFTISHHRTIHDVAYQTARTDLLDLWEQGLLIREKSGRMFEFRPPPDIENQLASLTVRARA